MEALRFDKKTGLIKRFNNCNIPNLENSNDVIIKVTYAGVCGTDLHIIEGCFPCNITKPFILGHEFCGIVESAGPTAHFKPGQRVVIDPNSGCSVCQFCHNGKYHLCNTGGINSTIGIFVDGGWAQYCKVPDTQIFLLPENVDFLEVLCEPLSCIVHGLERAGPISIGDQILILGAGIIGNLWTTMFHHQGHKNVTISEPNIKRLTMAQKMGYGYEYKQPHEVSKSGKKFDIIVDCTGIAKAMEDSISLINNSGRYILFGCADPKDYAKINPFHLYKLEASIIAVNINQFSFPKAIGLIESMGKSYLNYEKLGIEVFPLKDYEEAIKQLKLGNISKVMFKIDQHQKN